MGEKMVDKPLFAIHPLTGEPGIKCNVNTGDPEFRTLGYYLLSGPSKPFGVEDKANQLGSTNFTGPPGTASELYYALFFQLLKWGFFVVKPDEWIEVMPTHKEYYERTIATKQALEGTIKSGLASAASAVADFELLNHDLRKYKEILNYFSKKDEHSLRAMFIDYVDVHTGAISLIQIAPRWSTIIADFMKLGDKDLEPEAIAKRLNISKAEAVVLSTKNRLYQEWKKLFGEAARERYINLKGLIEGRKKSVKEYKEWLKPYISRFKMTKIGPGTPAAKSKIMTSFADVTGISTFANGITIWAWKWIKSEEFRRPLTVKEGDFSINPYDNWIRENYILDPRKGLAVIYPWLRNERKFCKKCNKYYPASTSKCEKCGATYFESKTVADEIVNREIIPMWLRRELGLNPDEPYYDLMELVIDRLGTRLPNGELEDITFNIRNFVCSHNVILVKLLELKCRERELDRYIDEILGIKSEEKGIEEIVKEEYGELFGEKKEELKGFDKFVKDLRESASHWIPKFNIPKGPETPFMFSKPGPYEREMYERLTKQYLQVGGGLYSQTVRFLKERMGVD